MQILDHCNQTGPRLLFALLVAAFGADRLHAQDTAGWEAKLPKGGETNLIELNLAKGSKEGAGYIRSELLREAEQERWRSGPVRTGDALIIKPPVVGVGLDKIELRAYKPEGLALKAQDVEGLFRACPTNLPPDMLGAGSFYLIKRKNDYHLLTPTNFARLFGPVTNREEVLPLVTFYEELFDNPFASVVTNREFRGVTTEEAPPDISSVTTTNGGFAVKLVIYNGHHQAYYAEKQLLVRTDGTVEVIKEFEIIKDLGPGIVF